ncbi:hypothetical protein BX600DRAFT_429611 [Xylariales sp. PMI_506]|nr:hypothetical protein BX600DRAFT_429611 [Xylariales sp. PMI_506]
MFTHYSRVLLAAASVGSIVVQAACANLTGCAALQVSYPTKVFYPGSEVYDYESTNFWSNTEILSPACVFRPETADDVAGAITTARTVEAEFAVRGGGHMGIKGSNDIDDGVLMVMSNLTTLQISEDLSTVVVGPGYRWGAVYAYLAGYDRGCAGGRLSPVGVPGLLLAGGVNYYGNQHGWSADNVLQYEVVLANGTIVNATSTEHSDLFWALKGGSSNFGIVTSFTLRTFESTQIWGGTYTVSGDYMDEFLAAIANFSAFNTDPLAHIVPMTVAETEDAAVAAVVLFYDSATISNPSCFAPFLEIPSIANSCQFQTLSELAIAVGGLVTDGINDAFIAGTAVGTDYDSLLQAVQITNTVFFDALPALYEVIPFSNISLVSIDWQPIGSLWQEGSEAANPTGNALGVDPASKGTYLAWAEVVEWYGDEYDDVVMAWVQNTTAAINAATQAAGLYDSFNYMGDASGFQEIYSGYGSANEAKLLEISRAYDPDRIFQTLLPGGFKIGV